MHNSPYVGRDFAAVDSAWDLLLGNMSLRVDSDELAEHSQSSVSLPDGGHLAWLGVYHELHCIKMLQRMNYREHYQPDLTEQGLRDQQVHVDHCIDQLREASMCRSDTESLTTFIWSERWDKPLLSPQRPQHRCVDWDSLVSSFQDRIVGEGELNRMSRPMETDWHSPI